MHGEQYDLSNIAKYLITIYIFFKNTLLTPNFNDFLDLSNIFLAPFKHFFRHFLAWNVDTANFLRY